MRVTLQQIQDVLGPAPKPAAVTQRQFDGHNDKLYEMSKLDWENIPHYYFDYYFYDLAYVDLQKDLFRHVFPACLNYWYGTLMENKPAGGFRDFHYGMMRGDIVNKMLTAEERERLNDFYCDAYLDRIEDQQGLIYETEKKHKRDTIGQSAYAWIARLNSLGIVAPVIERIWRQWWALDSAGKAYCAIMYASGLVYLKGENPIYPAWTRERGGGGPYLAEHDSTLFDWAWRDDNLDFLSSVLSADYIIENMEHATQVVSDSEYAETAQKVARDAKANLDIIQIKIDDLMEDLATLELKREFRAD